MVPYICMSCQPFFLKSVKIEAEYKEAKTMFQEKQGCSNPSRWSDLAKKHVQVQDEYDHSIPRSNYAVDEPQGKYGLTISKLKAGIFSEGLKELLKECSPSVNIHVAEGCYAHGVPQHADVYTTFQSILPAIFPWTATFSSSKTAQDNLKVVLSKPKTANGVEIPVWKEVTFFLPTKISIATDNICHFTVQILSKKVDYGELPLIIFQPNICKSVLDIILKTTDNLRVCPGMSDPTLVDVTERKKSKFVIPRSH